MARALKDGKIRCYWNTTNNNMQAGPNINGELLPGWRNPATFIVVSDVYPNASAMAADLILPSAMWVERKGPSATPSAAPSSGASRSRPRARPCSDLGQMMEFSKRFKVEEVWPAELIAKKPEFKGKTLFDILFGNRQGQPLSAGRPDEGQQQVHQGLPQ